MSISFGFIRLRPKLVLLIFTLLVVVFSTPSTSNAAGESVSFVNMLSIGCAGSATGFKWHATAPGHYNVHTVVDAGGLRYMNENVPGLIGNVDWPWHIYASTSGGPTTGSFPIPNDTPISIRLEMTNSPGGTPLAGIIITLSKCNGGSVVSVTSIFGGGSSTTFFNPGDSRIDGRPGDRIVVWCNAPDTIVVYGVKETDSGGFHLASFSNKALLKAGPKGIYIAVKNNGIVSISTDGKGNYWVAWNGGEHSANGQPGWGFAKGFTCDFPK